MRPMALVGRAAGALAFVLVVVVVARVAATDAEPAAPPAAAPVEPVFVQSTSRLTALAPEASEPILSVRRGLRSADGTHLFRGGPAASGGSRLVVFDPESGERTWSRRITEGFVARTAAHDGSVVVLTPPPAVNGAGYPIGRSFSPMEFVRLDGRPAVHLDLPGNVEPEAFSIDGRSLFVVEYLPALAPTRYRVRQVDVASGRMQAVESPDIGGDDTMGGTARSQALSPDGTRLYTLYTIPPGAEGGNHGIASEGRSFVHVLDLEERWAHCVDLPAPFGRDPGAAAVLAVTPDNDTLFVTDTATGAVAEVDTVNLSPEQVARPGVSVQPTAAAATDGGLLFVGGGGRLEMIDTATMERVGGWTTGGVVESLTLGDDGDLHVATPGWITIVAPDGDRRRVELPDDGPVSLGPGGLGLLGPQRVLECAC